MGVGRGVLVKMPKPARSLVSAVARSTRKLPPTKTNPAHLPLPPLAFLAREESLFLLPLRVRIGIDSQLTCRRSVVVVAAAAAARKKTGSFRN